VAAQTFGTTTQAPVAPRVNLLPPEISERNTLRRAQLMMAGTGLAAVAVVGVMYMNANAKVSSAQTAKTTAAAENVRLNSQLRSLQNVKDTYAQVDIANKTIESATHFEVLWSTYLQDMTLTIPDNVWLRTMSVKMTPATGAGQQGAGAGGKDAILDPGLGSVSFTGTALAHDDVAVWLESLAKERGYANPYFSDSHEKILNGRTVVDFTSTTNITDKALSKRYAKGLER
jgi:Tfp pilus assembly protein PilN